MKKSIVISFCLILTLSVISCDAESYDEGLQPSRFSNSKTGVEGDTISAQNASINVENDGPGEGVIIVIPPKK